MFLHVKDVCGECPTDNSTISFTTGSLMAQRVAAVSGFQFPLKLVSQASKKPSRALLCLSAVSRPGLCSKQFQTMYRRQLHLPTTGVVSAMNTDYVCPPYAEPRGDTLKKEPQAVSNRGSKYSSTYRALDKNRRRQSRL